MASHVSLSNALVKDGNVGSCTLITSTAGRWVELLISSNKSRYWAIRGFPASASRAFGSEYASRSTPVVSPRSKASLEYLVNNGAINSLKDTPSGVMRIFLTQSSSDKKLHKFLLKAGRHDPPSGSMTTPHDQSMLPKLPPWCRWAAFVSSEVIPG